MGAKVIVGRIVAAALLGGFVFMGYWTINQEQHRADGVQAIARLTREAETACDGGRSNDCAIATASIDARAAGVRLNESQRNTYGAIAAGFLIAAVVVFLVTRPPRVRATPPAS